MHSILLLHGAIGSKAQLEPIASKLSEHYNVHSLNFTGHGGNPVQDISFSIELFANDVLGYLNEKCLEPVSIFGYSMGGYIAMYLAKHWPQQINKIATLATKYHWSEEIAAKEVQMLDPGKLEAKAPSFAKTLEERHAPNDWKDVLSKTTAMMQALGKENALQPADYSTINNESLLMLGDRDKMVTLEETVNIYKILPNAQLAVLPGTAHPIEQVDIELLSSLLCKFFK